MSSLLLNAAIGESIGEAGENRAYRDEDDQSAGGEEAKTLLSHEAGSSL